MNKCMQKTVLKNKVNEKDFMYEHANSVYVSLSHNIGPIRAEVNQSKSEIRRCQ